MDKQTIAVIKQLFHFIEGICIFLRGYTVFIFSFGDILLNKLAYRMLKQLFLAMFFGFRDILHHFPIFLQKRKSWNFFWDGLHSLLRLQSL